MFDNKQHLATCNHTNRTVFQTSLNPVQILRQGAEEEKAEHARMVRDILLFSAI